MRTKAVFIISSQHGLMITTEQDDRPYLATVKSFPQMRKAICGTGPALHMHISAHLSAKLQFTSLTWTMHTRLFTRSNSIQVMYIAIPLILLWHNLLRLMFFAAQSYHPRISHYILILKNSFILKLSLPLGACKWFAQPTLFQWLERKNKPNVL